MTLNASNYGDLNSHEDEMLMQECGRNILKNLDRCLSKDNQNHHQVSRLLSMRWFVNNEISIKSN
jgi:hypothetical protein